MIGTAPSAELLATWNKREGELISHNEGCCPAVALGPEVKGAYVGQDLPDDLRAKIYREGCRTIVRLLRFRFGGADPFLAPS